MFHTRDPAIRRNCVVLFFSFIFPFFFFTETKMRSRPDFNNFSSESESGQGVDRILGASLTSSSYTRTLPARAPQVLAVPHAEILFHRRRHVESQGDIGYFCARTNAHSRARQRGRERETEEREKQREAERERINIVRTEGSLDVRVMFNVNSLERHSAGRRGFARSTS